MRPDRRAEPWIAESPVAWRSVAVSEPALARRGARRPSVRGRLARQQPSIRANGGVRRNAASARRRARPGVVAGCSRVEQSTAAVSRSRRPGDSISEELSSQRWFSRPRWRHQGRWSPSGSCLVLGEVGGTGPSASSVRRTGALAALVEVLVPLWCSAFHRAALMTYGLMAPVRADHSVRLAHRGSAFHQDIDR